MMRGICGGVKYAYDALNFEIWTPGKAVVASLGLPWDYQPQAAPAYHIADELPLLVLESH